MNDRKILYLVFAVIIYCLYCALMWYYKTDAEESTQTEAVSMVLEAIAENKTIVLEPIVVKKKIAPLCLKDACSVLDVFTKKPVTPKVGKAKAIMDDNNTLTVFGITIFLMILVINAIMDVLKVKEEEKLKLKLNPDGVRRQSLAEFANKKSLRRESSKFGFQMFQIAESSPSSEEDKTKSRQVRPYTRGYSTNSYLSEKKMKNDETSSRSLETPTGEPKLVKRQSVAKIFGARPSPMVRRSSFPVLPLNPEIQALMLGSRRPSTTGTDSDDEDGRGRRVRIIRRY